MKGKSRLAHTTSHKGVFLFFVVGLFVLQIVFAFTIHGDIGPQSPLTPDIQQATPQMVIGKIDSIVNQPVVHQPPHPTPEAIMAPAVKTIIEKPRTAGVSASISIPKKGPDLKEKGGRYLEYTITQGDTLDSISKKLYGNKVMVTALVRLNRLKNEKALKCGTKLFVPRSGLLK